MRRMMTALALAALMLVGLPAAAFAQYPPNPPGGTGVGSAGGAEAGAADASAGALAATGMDLSVGLVLVAVMLAAGAVLLMVARRRSAKA